MQKRSITHFEAKQKLNYSYEDIQNIRKMKGLKKWVYALKYIFMDYDKLNEFEVKNRTITEKILKEIETLENSLKRNLEQKERLLKIDENNGMFHHDYSMPKYIHIEHLDYSIKKYNERLDVLKDMIK